MPGFLTRSGHGGASLKRMDVVDWLLDGEPAVELATRVRLLGEDAASPLCADLRRRLMVEGTVPAILAAQGPDGHWGERDRFYTAKYTGTVWSLLILAEFGADGSDPRIRAAIEAILADSRHPASGAFGMSRSRRDGGGTGASVIPCLTGNMAFALVRLGQADDPRVRATIDWITTYLRFADGDGPWAVRPAIRTTVPSCAADAASFGRRRRRGGTALMVGVAVALGTASRHACPGPPGTRSRSTSTTWLLVLAGLAARARSVSIAGRRGDSASPGWTKLSGSAARIVQPSPRRTSAGPGRAPR